MGRFSTRRWSVNCIQRLSRFPFLAILLAAQMGWILRAVAVTATTPWSATYKATFTPYKDTCNTMLTTNRLLVKRVNICYTKSKTQIFDIISRACDLASDGQLQGKQKVPPRCMNKQLPVLMITFHVFRISLVFVLFHERSCWWDKEGYSSKDKV